MTAPCEPMLLRAAGQHALWGGNRLRNDFGKDYLKTPLSETWECSTHENGLSYVASGYWKGKTLKEVLELHPEYLGSKYASWKKLPVLVKFIDAAKDLSVQVHPDDDFASKYENGSLGKTEMWYVVDAEPDSCLVYGFYDDVTEEIVRKKLAAGEIEDLLLKVPVRKGDVFYIRPGTVHALGHGLLVVEVQESSDLTYRLYDYGRTDSFGRQRELQIDKAMAVCRMEKSVVAKRGMRIYRYRRGVSTETLCHTSYFSVDRCVCQRNSVFMVRDFKFCKDGFAIFICLSGCGNIKSDMTTEVFSKGSSIFIPAGIDAEFEGTFEGLVVAC